MNVFNDFINFVGVNKPGIQSFGNHRYWFSWQDPSLANQKWDWFNARNYCRKRCMDLVSFETEAEYNWVKGFMNGKRSVTLEFFSVKKIKKYLIFFVLDNFDLLLMICILQE